LRFMSIAAGLRSTRDGEARGYPPAP
jgi:hypothetical protein